MSYFSYLFKRSIINYFKGIKHKPSKIIPILFYLFIILMIALSVFFDSDGSSSNLKLSIYTGCVTGLCFLVMIYVIYSGITRQRFKYSLSDVNLIFTSPNKPQNVLLYGFIKEISFLIAMSFIIICQIPNLANNFKFVKNGILILIVITILFAISASFTSLVIYGLFVRFNKYKLLFAKLLKKIYIICGCLLLSSIYYNSNGDYISYVLDLFNKDFWNYIPIIGWTRAALFQCVYGINSNLIIYIGLLILVDILFATILYKINIDFYEDTLSSAEENEMAASMRNSGFDPKQSRSVLLNSKKNRFLLLRKKIDMSNLPILGKAIFMRHFYESTKTGLMLINYASIGYLAFSFFWGIKVKDSFTTLFFLAIYVLWLTINTGKWAQDFSTHYIFLIPDSSAKKLFYSTLSSILKSIIDSLFIFIPAGILLKENPILIICLIIAYISYSFVLTYGAVLNFKLFDRMSNQFVKGFFQLIALFIFVIPGIIIGGLLSFVFNFLGIFSLPLSITIYNIIICIIIVHYCKDVYDIIEV